MSFSTFSGPVRVGTVRENAGRNTGLVVLSQTATVAASTLSATPTAQPLFVIPAGSRINRIMVEKVTTLSGTSMTGINVTVGDGTTADQYVSSAAIALTQGMTTQATIDSAMKVQNTSNIGTNDVTFYGTFTPNALTSAAAGGPILVTVEYVQRASDGSANPVSA